MRRECRRAAARAPALAPPRLALLALGLVLGADAKAAATTTPSVAAPPTVELVDAGGKLASASEITSLLG